MSDESNLPTQRYYHPELDVLRFFAFLSVFVHHIIRQDNASYTQAIYLRYPGLINITKLVGISTGFGLQLFFFLSAFLISTLLVSEIRKTGSLHLVSFYLRRALRIWPLYYVALTIGVLIALQRHSTVELGLMGSFAIFIGNWYLLLGHSTGESPFFPLWSLSVEEQFYLLFPLILKYFGGNSVISIGIIATLGSLATIFIQGQMHCMLDVAIWGNAFAQMLFFGSGIILAVALHNRQWLISNTYRVLIMFSAVLMIAIANIYFEVSRDALASSGFNVTAGYILTALACAALIIGLYGCTWKFPKALIYLGKISYGLYVFHILSMQFFAHEAPRLHLYDIQARFASLSLTIVFAAASYKYLEMPFLRLKDRFSFVRSRPD